MNNRLMEKCYEFILAKKACRDLQGFFTLTYESLYPVAACILISSNVPYDEDKLRFCRSILKERDLARLGFPGLSEPILSACLAADPHPADKLAAAKRAYDILREYFTMSDYLPVASMFLTDFRNPEDYRRAAEDTKYVYDRMEEEHWFLTGREDVLYALLTAMTKEDYGAAVSEAEYIYAKLKRNFFLRKNSLQSLSHALVLCSGRPDEKIRRFNELIRLLKQQHRKTGSEYHVVCFGILANLGVELDQIMIDLMEADAFLAEQKDYHIFGFGKKTRLMHAVLILMAYYMTSGPELTAAVVMSVLSEIRQQQAAAASAAA